MESADLRDSGRELQTQSVQQHRMLSPRTLSSFMEQCSRCQQSADGTYPSSLTRQHHWRLWCMVTGQSSHSYTRYEPTVINKCQYSRDVHKTLSYKTERRPWSTFKNETRLRRSIFSNSQLLETETLNPQDRDETRHSTLKTKTRPRHSKNVSRLQCRSLKTLTVKSVTWQPVFAGQIHYFLPDISASLMHCMDVHKTCHETRDRRAETLYSSSRLRWDRDVWFSNSRDQNETEAFNLQDRDVPKNVSRPPRDRDVQDRDYIPAILWV